MHRRDDRTARPIYLPVVSTNANRTTVLKDDLLNPRFGHDRSTACPHNIGQSLGKSHRAANWDYPATLPLRRYGERHDTSSWSIDRLHHHHAKPQHGPPYMVAFEHVAYYFDAASVANGVIALLVLGPCVGIDIPRGVDEAREMFVPHSLPLFEESAPGVTVALRKSGELGCGSLLIAPQSNALSVWKGNDEDRVVADIAQAAPDNAQFIAGEQRIGGEVGMTG